MKFWTFFKKFYSFKLSFDLTHSFYKDSPFLSMSEVISVLTIQNWEKPMSNSLKQKSVTKQKILKGQIFKSLQFKTENSIFTPGQLLKQSAHLAREGSEKTIHSLLIFF